MKIKCRSLVSKDCYEGRPCKEIYEEDSMAGDGTYNGDSVVCDACYLEGGALDGRGVE
jgi:hypothetical protein